MSPRRKIPTKAELAQLQKHYKTDEKIGERLGGVPAYLVAYWRRKKNIPKHSHPKFSEKEIKNLWERLGDDDKCGLELGISKAAFYNWRRRYGFKEKPAFLKLEQLELNFPGLKLHSTSTSLYGKQSIAQKTIARLARLEKSEVGESIEIEPDLVISNINTNQVIQEFKKLPTEFVWNPDKILFTLADCYCEQSDSMSEVIKLIRGFVKRQNIKRFFDINEGLAHQITFEKGYIYPGQFILSNDRNTISYGCLSSMAACIDAKTMASVWAAGKLMFQVPKTICININGRRPRGVFSKDVALSVIKQLSSVDVKDKAIEFYGNTITQMSISERFTLTNLSLDMGARSIICPFDSITRRYLTGRTLKNYSPIIADKNAEYDEMYQINIDNLYPQLGKTGAVNDIRPVSDKEGLPIDLIILGTSSNGRFDDLKIAVDILKRKKINPECRLLICPGSRTVYLDALKKGLIRALVEAGAAIIYPGYGHFLDIKNSLLIPGERALVTTNNSIADCFNTDRSDVYLCSPATAAASALNAAITDPTRYVK